MLQVHKGKAIWPEIVVLEAKRLREAGASFSEITKELGVGKSTLHYWLKGFRLTSEEVKELRKKLGKNMQPAGARASHERKIKRNEETKEKVARLLDDLDVNNQQCCIGPKGLRGEEALHSQILIQNCVSFILNCSVTVIKLTNKKLESECMFITTII